MIAVKLNGNIPYESLPIEDNILPEGFDALWTEEQFNSYLSSITITIKPLKESVHKLAKAYQYSFFDTDGLQFLLNLKIDLMTMGNYDSLLPFQMLQAVNRWVNKVWSYAFVYDTLNDPVINYEGDVGLPPCSFRDILWVINPEFQQLEPNRDVNLDINYYINWV